MYVVAAKKWSTHMISQSAPLLCTTRRSAVAKNSITRSETGLVRVDHQYQLRTPPAAAAVAVQAAASGVADGEPSQSANAAATTTGIADESLEAIIADVLNANKAKLQRPVSVNSSRLELAIPTAAGSYQNPALVTGTLPPYDCRATLLG